MYAHCFNRCSCLLGFEGPTCQINVDDCEDNDCENGATCIDGINNYTCFCPPYYTGQCIYSWFKVDILKKKLKKIANPTLEVCFSLFVVATAKSNISQQ